MLFTIPILVEEHPPAQANAGLPNFMVRPLFHAAPVQRAEKLSRALAKLGNNLQDHLITLGKDPRHDELAAWTFNPVFEERTLELRLELKSGSHKCRFLLAGYEALGRKLYFATVQPDLQFEVRPGQSLAERATTVLTRYFRQREDDGVVDPEELLQAKARLTILEVFLSPAALAKKAKAPTRAMIFGGLEKKDGEAELRRTGRPLHQQYPDDLDRAVGREHEVAELARLLAANDRRPVLLVGPRKVGKTAIVHEVVWRMGNRKKERYGGNRQVWLVSPQRLISGMSYLGEWENRVLAILDHARDKDRVLFFDDLPGLFTAGISSASDLNVAQVLKPALEKRSVRVLAEITPEAWRVLRERDRAFADLFHVVPVSEPTEAETLQILISVTRQLEEQHRCEFEFEVVPTVYDLQRRFGGDAAFPGKAAGFLKRLAVRYERGHLSEAVALHAFGEHSGLHPAMIHDHLEMNRKDIVRQLSAIVVGQDHALNAFADVLVKLKARLHDPRRPLATFLMLGPTGVGKTQAAKALANYLFSDGDRMLRFDMNEYVDGAAVARLTGTPRDPEGLLTSAIRRQPFSVVLFDEIEKAAPEVFDLLLAVLDEGRLTDSLGRVADFTHSMILLTSNLGSREARSQLGFKAGDAAGDLDEVYTGAAEKFFRPEFFNRLDRVIPFRPLAPEQLKGIAEQLIAGVFNREGLRRRDCLLNVLPSVMARLVTLGHHPQLGARALKRVVEREVAQPLARRLSAMPPGTPSLVTLDEGRDEIVLRVDELKPTARTVFWGDRLATKRTSAEERIFLSTLLERVETFLDRIDSVLDEQEPAGRIEMGNVAPEQARYFYCREQRQKVQRIAQAVARGLQPKPVDRGAARMSRGRPTKVMVRQYSSGASALDRLKDAAAVKFELSDLETSESVELPDTPVSALLREAALLAAIAAPEPKQQPLLIEIRAYGLNDVRAVSLLAQLYQRAVAGLWGGSAQDLNSNDGNEEKATRKLRAVFGNQQGHQAILCEGLNLRKLLPAKDSSVLVRYSDGGLGLAFFSIREVESESKAQESAAESTREWKQRTEGKIVKVELGEAIHLFTDKKTITDFRSGAVVPVDASEDEARALLLSALPLPPELEF